MKIKQYVAFALIGLALGACNKPERGEDPTTVEPEGKMVKGQIAITMPKSIRTYVAPGENDNNATLDEIRPETINIFVYNDGGSYSLAYTAELTLSGGGGPGEGEFIINTTDETFESAVFDITEGDKLVYVGINLPDLIVERLKTGYHVNEIYEHPLLVEELLNNGTLGNVSFFNTGIVQHDFATAGDGPTVEVPVSRLVAKAAVMTPQAGDTWKVNGGTVQNLTFAVGQRNNQMFVSPRVDYTDPNYGAGAGDGTLTNSSVRKLADDDFGTPATAYKAVGDRTNFVDFRTTNPNVHYLTENMSDDHQHRDLTYISVRAEFIPHRWGADPENGDPVNTDPADDFYAVFTGDDPMTGDDALGVRYFTTIGDARTFVQDIYFEGLANGGVDIEDGDVTDLISDPLDPDAAAGEVDHYIHYYEDGYCYYRIYLNPDGDGPDGAGTVAPYDIIRNTAYIAVISGVNYIGTTAPDILPGSVNADGKGTPTYPGSWFPNNLLPQAISKEDQVSPTQMAADVETTVTLAPWESNEGEYETY